MNSTRQRIGELWDRGYQCSQIIMIMGLGSRGRDNPALIRAMAGLAGGCGEGSCTCGGLSAACCLLTLLIDSNGQPQERNQSRIELSTELVRWFWQKYGFPLSGIDCMAISEAGGSETQSERCQQILESLYEKVLEITMIKKIDINWGDCYAN